MADLLGNQTVPVGAEEPVGDPLRKTLGEYLQAALRYYCADAWNKLAPGTDVCGKVSTNDPSDNTFVSQRDGSLAVFRDDKNRKLVYVNDGMAYRECKLAVLWIPPVAVQVHKAARESFFMAIESAMFAGLIRGRVPTWIVSGDTDTTSTWRGSHIGNELGLMKPLQNSDLVFDDYTITIEMLGAEPRKYPSLRCMFTIWEQYQADPTINTSAALGLPQVDGDAIPSVNGVPWDTLGLA
jgi:hypothetical protein